MIFAIELNKVLTPELERELEVHRLKAVGVALMVEPDTSTISVLDGSKYRVVKGDTLSEIAATFDTTVEKLVQLNGIENPNSIQIGQVLRLY